MKIEVKVTGAISYICILFSITTVISSIIQLTQGIAYDTNTHILLRMVICIIAIIFIGTFKKVKIKNIYLRALVQYLLSMGCILFIVYVLGFFIELAKTAYIDIFLNYTIPFIIVATIIIFKGKKKTGKHES